MAEDEKGGLGGLGSRLKNLIGGAEEGPAAEVVPFGKAEDIDEDEGPMFSVDPDWPTVTGGWVHDRCAISTSPEEVRSHTMAQVSQMRSTVTTRADKLFLASLYALLGERDLGLPEFPETPIRLDQLLKEEEPNSLQVMRCIESDPQLVGRVWQRARSARFPSAPSSLDMAVSRIGMVEVWRLSLESALDAIEIHPGIYKDMARQVRIHGAIVGDVTAALSGQRRGPGFLAGLLHDVGKLLILQVASEHAPELTTVRRILTETHTSISVMITDAWRLDPQIVPAVAFHPDPNSMQAGAKDLIRLLCLADIAVFGELDRRVKKNSNFLRALAKFTESRALAGKAMLSASQCIDRMEADGLITVG